MGGLNNSEYKSGFNEYFTILFLTLGDFNEFFYSVKGGIGNVRSLGG